MDKLIEYLSSNRFDYQQEGDLINVDGIRYHYLEEEEYSFSEDFELILGEEISIFADNVLFKFGDSYYYHNLSLENKKVELNEFIYLGKAKQEMESENFLGIRGGYEILNGSRLYSDWIKKAKFLNIKNLGICEKNTLAGTLKFQLACEKSEIKSILGETISVQKENGDFYDLKCFVKNENGWRSLLLINKEITVINRGYIYEKDLPNLLNDLIVVLDPKSLKFNNEFHFIGDEDLYFQLDVPEFKDDVLDREVLENTLEFLKSGIKPVFINDAFYLEKKDSHIKRKLNSIKDFSDIISDDQYFKSKDDIFYQLENLFLDQGDFIDIFEKGIINEYEIVEKCNFKIETSKFHLPNYTLTPKQIEVYGDKYSLFWSLIEEGLMEKVPEDKIDFYFNRIETEFKIIEMGENLIDYFLILWDIINYCNENNILVGVGRGSSGGSLIAYCLGIISIDPIEYNLLFERFLNENRVSKSLPDIDSDFEGLRRNDVKKYMEERFGVDHVCSVGTYGNLKLKAGITDLARLQNVNVPRVKMVTKSLDDTESDGAVWSELFYLAKNSPKSKMITEFIDEYPGIIQDLKLCLMQPRNSSVHACATIIVPQEKTIFEWFPVKIEQDKDKNDILVSEWEGFELDKAGFLKEDILSLNQLDKFANTVKLIKENKGIDIIVNEIPNDDDKTYEYFGEGWNSDVFQFGTQGFKHYTKQLKPSSIEELSAANALYRPGAMKSNAHNDFVDIKFGKKQVEYDYLLEDITKNTFGLYIYQEQIMLAAQKLGGFTLTEADMLRKVMLAGKGKKQEVEKFHIYFNKFVEGAVKKGCSKKEAEGIWEKLKAFSLYGFNKSHSIAYAITGYRSQWFKVNYPLEFWTTTFEFSSDKVIYNLISEFNTVEKEVKLVNVDINSSRNHFYANPETNEIFWSLDKVRMVGESSMQVIEEELFKNNFSSFDDFINRSSKEGRKVPKNRVENLIYAGAFDKIENIEFPKDRINLFFAMKDVLNIKESDLKIFEEDISKLNEDWWWGLKQRYVSKFAYFDFKKIIQDSFTNHSLFMKYFSRGYDIIEGNKKGENIVTAGVVSEIVERNSVNGKWGLLTIDHNFEIFSLIIWNESWEKYKDQIEEECIIIFSGIVKFDTYRKNYNVTIGEKSIFKTLK